MRPGRVPAELGDRLRTLLALAVPAGAAGYQALDHPAAEDAKAVMQVAVAGTGAQSRLSGGSTNVLPVGDPAADATTLAAPR
jgi:hypothetical protein